jgi:hypothetical protein
MQFATDGQHHEQADVTTIDRPRVLMVAANA